MSVNPDILRERIRERREDYNGNYCYACSVALTDADYEAAECTNCGATLIDDESADEELYD